MSDQKILIAAIIVMCLVWGYILIVVAFGSPYQMWRDFVRSMVKRIHVSKEDF